MRAWSGLHEYSLPPNPSEGDGLRNTDRDPCAHYDCTRMTTCRSWFHLDVARVWLACHACESRWTSRLSTAHGSATAAAPGSGSPSACCTAAGSLAYAGTRLPLPVRATAAGKVTAVVMILAWAAAIAAFLACATIYVRQYLREYHPPQAAPTDRIAPVTLSRGSGGAHPHHPHAEFAGPGTRLASAAIGAMAARSCAFPRPHRHGQDLSPDSARPRLVPGPVLRAPGPDRDHHPAPQAVPHGEADQGHVLFLRADAGRVGGSSGPCPDSFPARAPSR